MKSRLGLLLFAVTTNTVFAQSISPTPIPEPFVAAEQLNVGSVLPMSPPDNSQQTRKELALLHALEKSRSAADIAHAQADDAQEDIFIFRNVLGADFTRESLPRTAALGDHVHGNEGIIVNPAKNFFRRPRPYNLDKTLKPVCKVKTDPGDYAYPSGHGTTGYLEALVLAMMVPEKRDAILARADEYAHNRLVCGVHYPTDVAASKSVAYAIIGLMMNDPRFIEEFEAARAETRLALGFELGSNND